MTFDMIATYFTSRIADERGASLVEYALLVALIAVVCIAAVSALGGTISDNFDSVSSTMANNGANAGN